MCPTFTTFTLKDWDNRKAQIVEQTTREDIGIESEK